MPTARRQAMLDAPVERVWALIGDVNRHPEWWPRVEEVECDLLEEGCTYRQVTDRPGGSIETTISIERLDDCHELSLRCLDTGMYARFLLTPAQAGTFVDGELGVEADGFIERIATPVFVRRWIAQSLEGLRRAAREQPRDQRSDQSSH
ncbi:MAG TPA: SRPBCC family protein [Thermoleophilaceae bacterium]